MGRSVSVFFFSFSLLSLKNVIATSKLVLHYLWSILFDESSFNVRLTMKSNMLYFKQNCLKRPRQGYQFKEHKPMIYSAYQLNSKYGGPKVFC